METKTRKGIGSHQSARMQKDEWLTPQEKALDLCQKFGYVTMNSPDNNGVTLSLESAKKCAMICTEIVLDDLKESLHISTNDNFHPHAAGLIGGSISFWNAVKTEIENL